MIVLIVVLLIASILITVINIFFDFINHKELGIKYKPKAIELFFLFVEILTLGLIVYVWG